MMSAFNTKSRFHSKKGETLLLQTDMTKANVVIPKLIQWSQVTLPQDWILERATKTQCEKLENPLLNTQIKHITQFQDGRVKINFDRASYSSRFFDVSSSESVDLGRVSQIPSIINLPYKEQPYYRETSHHNPDVPRVINLPYTEQVNLHPNLPPIINLPYTSKSSN